MHETHTPKASDGASVSRRKFMAFAAAGSAATLPAVALAEASGKTSRLPQPSDELPIERFDRHSIEIADVLNEYMDGKFYACIYPSAAYEYPVILKSISAETYTPPIDVRFKQAIERLRGVLQEMHPEAAIQTQYCVGQDVGSFSVWMHAFDQEGGAA